MVAAPVGMDYRRHADLHDPNASTPAYFAFAAHATLHIKQYLSVFL